MTEKVFREKCPGIMALLMRDFDLTVGEAAAIMGNLGHESGGLTQFQEVKPTVPGSRGGFGWAQWTGPRRLAFEAYCRRNRLDPKSDRANYGFLFVELKGSESGALKALREAGTLNQKVTAFERAYERAGVKHYPSRNKWARRALEAYEAARPVSPPEWALPSAPPDVEPTDPAPEAGFSWAPLVLAILALAVIGVALFIL